MAIDRVGDCYSKRVVSKERGQQMASSLGVPFRELNPKTDDVKYVNEVLI